MEWTIALAAIWIIALIYRRKLKRKVRDHLSSRRQTIWDIAYQLKVPPELVENMIEAMDGERGAYFLDQVNNGDDEALSDAVYIFYIFQILKNDNHQNIMMWVKKMAKNGYSARLNSRIVDVAFSYFKKLNVNGMRPDQFSQIYNDQYCSDQNNVLVTKEITIPEAITEEVSDFFEEASLTPKFVNMQLQMTQTNILNLSNNEFVLGYLFGAAEMEYYQKGGELQDQTKSLNYILSSFNQIAPEESSDAFETCLNMQKSPKFAAGRQRGADEMGDWFRSSGQKIPLGLIEVLKH